MRVFRQSIHIHCQLIRALLSKFCRLASRSLFDRPGGMFVRSGWKNGPGDGLSQSIFHGHKVTKATAHRRDGLGIVFGEEGDEIGPVGWTGEESSALDLHGVGDGDFAVGRVEGGWGDVGG